MNRFVTVLCDRRAIANVQSQNFWEEKYTANTWYKYYYKYYFSSLPLLDRFVYYHLFRAWPCSPIDFDDIAYASCELIASPFEDKALLFVKIGRGGEKKKKKERTIYTIFSLLFIYSISSCTESRLTNRFFFFFFFIQSQSSRYWFNSAPPANFLPDTRNASIRFIYRESSLSRQTSRPLPSPPQFSGEPSFPFFFFFSEERNHSRRNFSTWSRIIN